MGREVKYFCVNPTPKPTPRPIAMSNKEMMAMEKFLGPSPQTFRCLEGAGETSWLTASIFMVVESMDNWMQEKDWRSGRDGQDTSVQRSISVTEDPLRVIYTQYAVQELECANIRAGCQTPESRN